MNNRRDFLKKFALSAGALLIADKIHADPYNTLLTRKNIDPNADRINIKISGHVKADQKGLKNVAVSDGISVVLTDENGFYSIVSDNLQRFVFISIPSGYTLPTNPSGTAKFYHQINNKQEQRADFILQKEKDTNDEHSFLVFADPQTLDMDDINLLHTQTVPDVQKLLKNISVPVFGVTAGDIMFDHLELFPEYEKAVKQMGLPCFQVLGNHDVEVMSRTDEQSIRTFQRYFGPAYYSFNRGEIHYVVLDDIFWFGGYIGYLSQVQLDWLRNDLRYVEKGKTVVVFAHIPIYTEQHLRYGEKKPSNSLVVTNRDLLYKLLEPYNAYLICGHTHESEYIINQGIEHHVGGAVCGAWWTGPVCFDGTPNGYSVYSVKGSNLTWKYKSVGFDLDHQMRLYRKDNSILANVWNADKNWKVSIYGSGIKTEMKQTQDFDPLSVELHQGDKKPVKHPWVDPVPTTHMFTAQLPADAAEITVEAADRWGNIYTEKLM